MSSTSYNNYPSGPPPNSSFPHSSETIPSKIATSFKRQNNDPILWFANPPINVPPPSNPPVHSIAYLNYKQKQQQQQKQQQSSSSN